MATKIVKCLNCSAENTGLASFCRSCGSTLLDGNLNQQFYRDQQIQRHSSTGSLPGADKKILAGVLGILLGGIGVHKFIIGYNREGIIMLSSQLISCDTCDRQLWNFIFPSVLSLRGRIRRGNYIFVQIRRRICSDLCDWQKTLVLRGS